MMRMMMMEQWFGLGIGCYFVRNQSEVSYNFRTRPGAGEWVVAVFCGVVLGSGSRCRVCYAEKGITQNTDTTEIK